MIEGRSQDKTADQLALPLPAHGEHCLGCGPDNPAGLHMRVERLGDEVVTELVLDRRHVGAPGLAHGGAVATACDDLFGFVLYLVGELAVTRSLQVEYLVPTRLGEPYRIAARLDRRDGRDLHMSAEGAGPDGRVAFSARAVFRVVNRSHFERFGPLITHPGFQRLRGAGG
ncbi:MAG TPA: PaaI family thioesterase [Pseudonocardia sp.]|nr:PaaI family thioesterase [Pseudonocardia sp.]